MIEISAAQHAAALGIPVRAMTLGPLEFDLDTNT
jgi:hypothetical protein